MPLYFVMDKNLKKHSILFILILCQFSLLGQQVCTRSRVYPSFALSDLFFFSTAAKILGSYKCETFFKFNLDWKSFRKRYL